MGYEWDPAKARANFAKHGVRFADAATVLEDDLALTIRDPFSGDEERWLLWDETYLAVFWSRFMHGVERMFA